MMRHWIARAIRFVLFVFIACAAFGLVVMALWNWLMPTLFGLRMITYWQALGLVVLSKILFGGFRGGYGYRGRWRRRMMERWSQMTPEDREKFREAIRGRCGNRAATEGKA